MIEPHRRFVTYERYGGRFNNQIFQLAVAFQASKRFGLTLVVPYETRKVDWTGLFESREGTLPVWDLAGLDDKYDWMLESEYEERFGAALSAHPDAGDASCTVDPKVLFTSRSASVHCGLLNLGGATRLLNCGKNRFCGDAHDQRLAFDFYRALRPHAAILREAEGVGQFPVGLHSRSFLGSKDASICPGKSDEVLRKHLATKDELIYSMGHHVCSTLQPKSLPWLAETYGQSLERFVFSSDSQDVPHTGAVRVPVTRIPFDVSKTKRVVGSVSGLKAYAPKDEDVQGTLQILMEQHVLAASDFFIGNLYSTFSFSVCMIRGEAARHLSNVCPINLHPDSLKLNAAEYWKGVRGHTETLKGFRRVD